MTEIRETSRIVLAILFATTLISTLGGPQFQLLHQLRRKIILLTFAPVILLLESSKSLHGALQGLFSSRLPWGSVVPDCIDETQFPQEEEFRRILLRLEEAGLRSTGNKSHEGFVKWIESKMSKLPGIELTSDSFNFLRWQTKNELSLHDAGSLTVDDQSVPIAGAIPYSKPTSASGASGQLFMVSEGTRIADVDVRNKVVIRKLSKARIPMMMAWVPAYSKTSDLKGDILSDYDRPSFWEHPIHNDLIQAGDGNAVAMLFVFDTPRDQMESYWDPHQGTHYHLPALFIGVDECQHLEAKASTGAIATVTVLAEVSSATTRNLIATLPGQSDERIIYSSHTDGNTVVQDNGVAALMTLAQHFANQPISARRRTLEFAFNTAHLHVSKEGSGRHAEQLDASYNDGTTALVIPVEHMGTREIESRARKSNNGTQPGRELYFTGRGEAMIWCVGPSTPLVRAVQRAVSHRRLDRVLITRGTSKPQVGRVPLFDSFGGLGTLYHNFLVPTTSLISGPWSLFAPSFGQAAVDVARLRAQTLAVGDLYLAVEGMTREQIAGGYLSYRERRARGAYAPGFAYPPETLPVVEAVAAK